MGSVVDTNAAPGATAGGGVPEGKRHEPVAMEVPVTATGARPTTSNGQRDLFSEETETVLVAKDGAVIRLSAAVATGQLLFLTNKTSKKEVVCQVLKKRSFRPTSCYVELQFTEPDEDFWGVKFPEDGGGIADAPEGTGGPGLKNEAAAAAAEMVASAEETEEESGARTAAPSDEEVNKLRGEVEALRKQLKSLMKPEERLKQAEVSAPVSGAPVVSQEKEGAAPPRVVRMKIPVAKGGAAENWAAMQEAAKENAQPAGKTNDGKAAMDETVKAEKAQAKVEPQSKEMDDAFEALLPKPELDFSKVPKKKPVDLNDPAGIYKQAGRRTGARLAALAAVLAVAGVGGAWYMNLLPFAKRVKPAVAGRTASVPKPVSASSAGAVATPPAAPAASPTAVELPKSAAEPEKNVADTTSAVGGAAPPVETAKADPPIPVYVAPGPVEDVPELRGAIPRAAKSGSSSARGSSVRRVGAADKAATAVVPVAPEAGTEGVGFVAPKLLKAVNPVYPVDAMRSYITGDVRVDALVGENGRVKSIEVKFGPKALRPAAVEAMKQYVYEPARQNGKPVAAHVVTTVKFWFNP